ncbi:Myb-like DNA-binding domain containing protein [Trichomonas vaginalis G3]|uniref:Myb-like DNA-binding domain containing protein n=1 Tax=Trichomonas vaginalis (strain ATCC PRA-98 / G3) TaxID=412133 RepID=A2GJL6_TRIV3|nr:Myb-like DNA-binding domain containing protein [Trichomonas vaginalis G3]|eukprot:XP_001295581.1 Myb-like DNA-binding domain containing protein [Trichomonas vaginalis G3]
MDRLLPNGQSPHEANFEKRAKFTPAEDAKLKKLVNEFGSHPNWRSISIKMKMRTPRQCRERYQNYLSPKIKVSTWTEEENRIILEKYQEYGNQWNKISHFMEGRTGNAIRNQFQLLTRHQIKKNQKKMGHY